MRCFHLRSLFALLLAGVGLGAHAAEDCGFLPTTAVNEAFAGFAPWSTVVGGAVGHCSFVSDERAPPNLIAFMQQFKTTKAAAGAVYDGMRQGFAANHVMREVKGLGERAFRYEPKGSNAIGSRTSVIVAQKDRLVLTVKLTLQEAVTDDDVQAAARLAHVALRGANDPETLRKASTCPWFDDGGLTQLFGGKTYEVQVHGENSCMAADKQSRVLLLWALKDSGADLLGALHTDTCQTRSVPELGKDAKLSFACRGGNPRATTGFVENGVVIQLTWTPAGAEPSDADKAALLALAQSARSLQAAR